jgi:putative hydrolase of the HAD superfamily
MMTSTRGIEWLLFDLGGVLVEVDQARIFDSLAHNLSMAPTAVKDAVLGSVALNSAFITEEYLPDRITKEVNRALRAELTEAQVVTSINSELGGTINSTADLLPKLRGKVKVGCLSNTNSIHWEHLLRAHPFMNLFDRRFASQIIGHAKPGREIYEQVMLNLGVSGNEILFFDDRQENVNTARLLGWNARLYCSHDKLISDLGEFSLSCE